MSESKKRLYVNYSKRRMIPSKGQFRLHPKNPNLLQEWTGFRWKNRRLLTTDESDRTGNQANL